MWILARMPVHTHTHTHTYTHIHTHADSSLEGLVMRVVMDVMQRELPQIMTLFASTLKDFLAEQPELQLPDLMASVETFATKVSVCMCFVSVPLVGGCAAKAASAQFDGCG